ncbi:MULTISPECIES: hypothetical protein [unclassified Streptomyces]|uniref:hypothetical protein n=1 Tax=unclassified Streptomyces TaxID=2593676 RepID=UPI000361ED04|nr:MULTISPECIES: hypothetical protein [unclassified Streptomyces]MYX39363.1 hypothetical protein [Streptomyces sp. SID8377]
MGAIAGNGGWRRTAPSGSCRAGSRADRDPFAGPPERIAATRVLQTFVGGVRVYAAPDA